ncbi:MAG TPA: hypothetical protein PLL86_25325, partial [Leptospiraceae bacterium]|nr:hypothetical protein [Leptospiraceae bacterium]
GNPFSARVTFKVFIEPALYKFMHLNKPKSIFLPLLSERKKKHGMEEYFRARIVNKENKSYIKEISSNGSGDYLNSFGTDGIAIHPANNMELPQGINLEFLYW